MTRQAPRNPGASIHQRLLNYAHERGEDATFILQRYAAERFLYRLGVSPHREQFVLKGAMLLRLWSDQPYRATRDLDLLRRGDGSFDAIREDIRAICATPVGADAVVFDADAIGVEAIRPEDEYAGARTTLPTRCGAARLTLQIDMGVGVRCGPRRSRASTRCCSTFRRLKCLPIRARRWSRKNSKRWWSSAIATAGSRTSSTCITWQAASSSTGRRLRRPSGEPLRDAARLFRARNLSD